MRNKKSNKMEATEEVFRSFLDFEEKDKKREGIINCTRYSLTIFNLFFFLQGVLLLTLSFWVRWLPSNILLLTIGVSERTRDYVLLLIFLTAIIGAFIIFLSVIGCFGSFSKSKYILGMFFMFLVALFFVLIAVVWLSFWLLSKISLDARHQLTMTFIQSYYGDNATNLESFAWSRVQADLQCCGINKNDGDMDYSNLTSDIKVKGEILTGAAFWRTNGSEYRTWPRSCCIKNTTSDNFIDLQPCQTNQSATHARYKEGCGEKVTSLLRWNMIKVVIITFGLIFVEIINFTILRQLEALMFEKEDDSIITEVSMKPSLDGT